MSRYLLLTHLVALLGGLCSGKGREDLLTEVAVLAGVGIVGTLNVARTFRWEQRTWQLSLAENTSRVGEKGLDLCTALGCKKSARCSRIAHSMSRCPGQKCRQAFAWTIWQRNKRCRPC